MNASGSFTEQRARFELLGGIGAAVLGAGVGLVFRDLLAPLALPLLLVGLVVHGWAMWGKHRVDTSGSAAMPRWAVWGVLDLLGTHRRARYLRGLGYAVKAVRGPRE
jgi:hypothetical protein